jgi:beta-xylosidase
MKPKLTILLLLFASSHHLSAQPYTAQRAEDSHLTNESPADGHLPVRPSTLRRFTNPVIPGDFADPTIIRRGDTYFAAGTSSEWAPHYPVFESKDLVNWSYTGPAFTTKPEWTMASFWAPELFVLNEKVYLYYTARRASDGVSCIGVATTDDIRNGFRDHGCLVGFGSEAIDAFVFEDDGKLYISWKAYGLDPRPVELLCAELSPDGLSLAGEPFTLLKDEENVGMEGQYLYKKGNWYYLIYSIRGCCGAGSDYAVCVARSESLGGPYEKYAANPILQGDGETVLSCGHGTAVVTPAGESFYLFHAYLKGAGFYNGRQAFLKELAVKEDGWPYFVTGKYACLQEPAPSGQIRQAAAIPAFEDCFDGNVLRAEWCWNFTFSDLCARIENNTLLLSGSALEGNRYGTALCLRTLRPDYAIAAEIKDQEGIFSGLTLYGDKENLIILGLENGRIVLKRIKKGEETLLYQKVSGGGNVHLKIAVSGGSRASFSQSSDGENWIPLSVAVEQEADALLPSVDVSFLPPWDRAFRPGLIHIGDAALPATFACCRLSY